MDIKKIINIMNSPMPTNLITYIKMDQFFKMKYIKLTQAGIKIARRNINNLRYADDTTLMAESEEELKSLLTVWITINCGKLSNTRPSVQWLN